MERSEGGTTGEGLKLITGSFSPKRGAKTAHHVGYDNAIKDALQKAAADPAWQKARSIPVRVRLRARVEITNPGAIGDYIAQLDPTP